MISILILGKGNVGTHLYKALDKLNFYQLEFRSSRNLKNIPKVDLTILTVSDNAISEVSSKLKQPFIVHTSGSLGLNEINSNGRKGVFYMLQSFSKEKPVHFSTVPFCLEAEENDDLRLLQSIAKQLSNRIYTINSNQRQYLHVAAVFANNFSNHMLTLASNICEKNNVPFQILNPLIEETFEKIKTLAPEDAQTGPAIRKDSKTIKNHLTLLDKNMQELYLILTKSIQNGN